MKRKLILWGATSLMASTATATPCAAQSHDKPLIVPAPAWVKPVTPAAADGPDDGSPLRVLLSDQQAMLSPGKQTVYTASTIKIETPQGLAAGNISLPWRPDSSTLAVHKLLIHRGAQVIDVLANQSITVVRREVNLENAVLDGVLTANIQPEGLQVGDVLEFAASVTTSDPTLKDHVEQIGGGWNGAPIGRAHLRVEWPNDLPVQMRATEGLPQPKRLKGPATTSIEITSENMQPLAPPNAAPGRFSKLRLLELSDYKDWTQLSALMAPLYARAAAIPADSPLQAEVAKLRAASSDPKTRAEGALQLVESRVRYVALSMGTGNYVPADAGTTWARRYGDCKGKTAMLIGILQALGIDSAPVLVSTGAGDGLDADLPMVGLFDHVIVRAVVAGKTYWLDATRVGDTALDRLEMPNYGWGLLVAPDKGALVRMLPPPLDRPSSERTVRIDATAGISLPAPFHVEQIFRGDAALNMKLTLAKLAGDARVRALREFWKQEYDFVEVAKTDAVFDDKTGEQRLTMDGTAKMAWGSIGYETDGTAVGYKADFRREPGPFANAPVAVTYPYFSKNTETILLPDGFGQPQKPVAVDIDQTVAGIHYHRESGVIGNRFVVEKTERSLVPEFPYEEAASAQKTLRGWAEDALYLRKPDRYRATDQELAAKLAETPTTADAYSERARLLMMRSKYDASISDYDRADALKPHDEWILANRGLAYAWKGDATNAEADLHAAEAIDAGNYVAAHARGLLADRRGDTQAAIEAYGIAIRNQPSDEWGLRRRADDYRRLKQYDRALADLTAAGEIAPGDADLYLQRANILMQKGDRAGAAAEAARLSAMKPATSYAHVAAANLYSALDNRDAAMREFDLALAVEPAPYIYINRALARPSGDVAARRADLEAATKLDPTMVQAALALSALETRAGRFDAALAAIAPALAKTPNDADLLLRHGLVLTARGDTALADKDFAAARSAMTDAEQFNNACWTKATAGLAMASALQDCEKAVASAPNVPAFEDSLGFVLLRMGRLKESVAAYDKALAKAPEQAASLFGRAMAKAGLGDRAGSREDRAAALAAFPKVEDEFASYGLTPLHD